MDDVILSIHNLEKSFGATHANNHITLDIKRGSVHGLVGENGSGKSTLASIICGIQQTDSGEMFLNGERYAPQTPLDSNKAKVAMVMQELGTVGEIPPAVNVFLGRTGQFSRYGFLDLKKLKEAARRQWEIWELGQPIMNGTTGELSIEHRKILELVRALSVNPDFLVLDEISQALSHDNREMLYRFIKKFTEQNKTILIITHDMEEMQSVCDTVSILRDGEVVSTKEDKQFEINEIKQLMIGRKIEQDYYRDDKEERFDQEVVLRAENISVPGGIQDVSFELHKGEILGVCGLSDAGIHNLGMALFGVEHRTGILVYAPGGKYINNTGDFIESGGAYLSKDRDIYGLMLDASITGNISVSNAKRLSGNFGFLSPKKLNNLSLLAARDYNIKAAHLEQIVRTLSGGNKQKVNLSRWLVQSLNFIVLDCPTRGVDISVKAYIYGVLEQAKAKGLAVLLISDELPEAIGMSDRIMVLRQYRIAATLSRNDTFTESKIVEVMM
jgi:ribose transport system ATP-binding protein